MFGQVAEFSIYARQSQLNIRNHKSRNADRDGERHRRVTSYGSMAREVLMPSNVSPEARGHRRGSARWNASLSWQS